MTLPPLPDTFAATRQALHRAAEDVIAPARREATGHEISLRALPGGFGAPAFPGGTWIRVEGHEIVRPDLSREAIDGADPAAAEALARVFAFATALLEALRDDADDASAVLLWPEHFDVAITMGEANYGVSPGDESHAEPYLYAGPWTGGFEALPWSELVAAADPHATALAWMRERRDALLT